jgi:hypothetical protein
MVSVTDECNMSMEYWWNNSDRIPNAWIKKTCPSATLSATKPQELALGRKPTSVFRGQINHLGAMAQPLKLLTAQKEIMHVSTGLLITFIKWYMCTYVQCSSQKKTCSLHQ